MKKSTYYISVTLLMLAYLAFAGWQYAKADIYGSSLVAWYTMDSNNTVSNITDSSGNGNNGNYVHTSATSTVLGKQAQGIVCNPGGDTGDYINTNYSTTLHTITFSAWVYMRSIGGGGLGRIFDKRVSGSQSILLYSANAGITNIGFIRNTTGGQLTTTTNLALPLNKWVMVSVTFDDGLLADLPIIYWNGTTTPVTTVVTGTLPFVDNTDAFVLCNRANDGARNWDGYLDDVRMYNRVLSPAEIQTIYYQSFGQHSNE